MNEIMHTIVNPLMDNWSAIQSYGGYVVLGVAVVWGFLIALIKGVNQFKNISLVALRTKKLERELAKEDEGLLCLPARIHVPTSQEVRKYAADRVSHSQAQEELKKMLYGDSQNTSSQHAARDHSSHRCCNKLHASTTGKPIRFLPDSFPRVETAKNQASRTAIILPWTLIMGIHFTYILINNRSISIESHIVILCVLIIPWSYLLFSHYVFGPLSRAVGRHLYSSLLDKES